MYWLLTTFQLPTNSKLRHSKLLQIVLVVLQINSFGVVQANQAIPIVLPLLHQEPDHLLHSDLLDVRAPPTPCDQGVGDEGLQHPTFFITPSCLQQTLHVDVEKTRVCQDCINVDMVVSGGVRFFSLDGDGGEAQKKDDEELHGGWY